MKKQTAKMGTKNQTKIIKIATKLKKQIKCQIKQIKPKKPKKLIKLVKLIKLIKIIKIVKTTNQNKCKKK